MLRMELIRRALHEQNNAHNRGRSFKAISDVLNATTFTYYSSEGSDRSDAVAWLDALSIFPRVAVMCPIKLAQGPASGLHRRQASQWSSSPINVTWRKSDITLHLLMGETIAQSPWDAAFILAWLVIL